MGKVAAVAGVAVALGLAIWLLLHAFISPVNPSQNPPQKHISSHCWACHFVSKSARVVEP